MIKLAYGNEQVYVSLSKAEFKGLSGQTYTSVDDGTNISLVELSKKIALVDDKKAELVELKAIASDMVAKLSDIGV